MKKIFAILAMAASASAFAVTAGLEYQNQTGVNGTADSQNIGLSVKEKINDAFSGDVAFSNTNKETTGAISSTRLEAGLTASKTYGIVSPYARVALGQKYTSTTNFTYYSVEPGVSLPIGSTGLTAKVGYRYRTATDSANADTTRTARAGLSYALTPKDTIGVRYDRQRGDSEQNIWAVNYTRGF
jgi:hypothetical protein